MISTDLVGAERLGGVAGEVVALLVDLGAVEDPGMVHDEAEPPRGAGLLHPDPDEVGGPGPLPGPEGRGRVGEARLPGGEGTDPAADTVPHGAREPLAQAFRCPVQRLAERRPEAHGVRLPHRTSFDNLDAAPMVGSVSSGGR